MDGICPHNRCHEWCIHQWPHRGPLFTPLVHPVLQPCLPCGFSNPGSCDKHSYPFRWTVDSRSFRWNVIHGSPSLYQRGCAPESPWQPCRLAATCYYFGYHGSILVGLWDTAHRWHGEWSVTSCMAVSIGISHPDTCHDVSSVQSLLACPSRQV